ncbi:hypothetical protein BDW22DRAFT_1482912 [Trametopsis cervina]|nr:hypothetical protein BDW22DRAFT_1482912 [Trametopsis cervina]
MESKKRKREDDADPAATTVVTYHAPNGRTFSRVFKEKSLEHTRETVRKKLNLSPNVKLELAQLRNDKVVDLEDDDDFLALRALARTNMSLDILVTVSSHSPGSSEPQHDTTVAQQPLELVDVTLSSTRLSDSRQRSSAATPDPSHNGQVWVPTATSTPHNLESLPAPRQKVKVNRGVDTYATADAGPSASPSFVPVPLDSSPKSPPKKKVRISKTVNQEPVGLASATNDVAVGDSASEPKKTGKESRATTKVTAEPAKKTTKEKKKASHDGTEPDLITSDPTTTVKKRKTAMPEEPEQPIASSSKLPRAEPLPSQGENALKKSKTSKKVPDEEYDESTPEPKRRRTGKDKVAVAKSGPKEKKSTHVLDVVEVATTPTPLAGQTGSTPSPVADTPDQLSSQVKTPGQRGRPRKVKVGEATLGKGKGKAAKAGESAVVDKDGDVTPPADLETVKAGVRETIRLFVKNLGRSSDSTPPASRV